LFTYLFFVKKFQYFAAALAKNCTIFVSNNLSYLGEFEAEFKKALARESGAQGLLFDGKTKGRKSHYIVSLKVSFRPATAVCCEDRRKAVYTLCIPL
jgi:hypothetical protein